MKRLKSNRNDIKSTTTTTTKKNVNYTQFRKKNNEQTENK